MAGADDRFAIIDLAALYMRGLDRLDGDLLAAQFWPDAACEYGIFSGSPAEFATFCMAALADHDRNHHMLGQHLIDFTSADEALGEVYYQAYHRTTDGDGAKRDLFIAGRYVDRYERREGVWKIAYRSELVDWLRDDPASDTMLAAAPFIIGQRKPDDPLYNREAMRA
ncbi:nuclear transport factor 2 family protein [Porphyrobacter sp. ULC335]|uniref:nuclear transport factor 2 family protein n=1 Tax=Porphyrobacter sp. ULC335 TaxID=2854260 RepID=UPI0022211401|nr:nuclear transport factor 2 family protein [Porphyrobacter sp. ULC335]UYV15241.1 nuclear transport factor 2 family protein [Porphyrobacter sp. ULC335]